MQKDLFPNEIDTTNLNQSSLIKAQKILNDSMVDYLRKLALKKECLWIPGNVPSLKNSKEILQIHTKKSLCCHRKGGLMEKDNDGHWRCSNCGELAQRYSKPILTKSKRAQLYEAEKQSFLTKQKNVWMNMIRDCEPPYLLAMYFIRDSERIFDYVNASQIILDMMSEEGYYVDDNMLHVIPEFLGFHVDSLKPGVIITLMNKELINFKYKKIL